MVGGVIVLGAIGLAVGVTAGTGGTGAPAGGALVISGTAIATVIIFGENDDKGDKK